MAINGHFALETSQWLHAVCFLAWQVRLVKFTGSQLVTFEARKLLQVVKTGPESFSDATGSVRAKQFLSIISLTHPLLVIYELFHQQIHQKLAS